MPFAQEANGSGTSCFRKRRNVDVPGKHVDSPVSEGEAITKKCKTIAEERKESERFLERRKGCKHARRGIVRKVAWGKKEKIDAFSEGEKAGGGTTHHKKEGRRGKKRKYGIARRARSRKKKREKKEANPPQY